MMNRALITLMALLALVFAAPADAKNNNSHKENGQSGFCPPGLAKKNPPCVPPGLAKKGSRSYETGDWIGDDDYHNVIYPGRYGLPPLGPNERYVILDGQILKVQKDTYEVITLIRAVEAILD